MHLKFLRQIDIGNYCTGLRTKTTSVPQMYRTQELYLNPPSSNKQRYTNLVGYWHVQSCK